MKDKDQQLPKDHYRLISTPDKPTHRLLDLMKSRRWFLTAMGLTGVGLSTLTDQFYAHLKGFFTRSTKEIGLGYGTLEEDRNRLYEKYPELVGRISPNQWHYFCSQMDRLVNIMHANQDNKAELDYYEYFTQFISELHAACGTVGTDFAVVSQIAVISAENLGSDNWQRDVDAGQVQNIVGTITALGGKDLLQDYLLDRTGLIDWVFTNTLLNKMITRPEISIYDSTRLDAPVTHTVWDIETEVIAKSIRGTPIEAEWKVKYPKLTAAFERLEQAREKHELARSELLQVALSFDREFSHLFQILFNINDPASSEAWEELGISSDYIDAYHIFNPTYTWKFIVTNNILFDTQDPAAFYRDVAHGARAYYATQGPMQHLALLSQQIQNPRFINWLRTNARAAEDVAAVAAVSKLEQALAQYRITTKELDTEEANACSESMVIEYDIRATAQIGAAFIGKLITQALQAFPEAKGTSFDQTAFTTWAAASVRDIASVDQLVHKLFARNTLVDPVYETEGTLSDTKYLVESMQTDGLLRRQPWEEFQDFLNVCLNMEQNKYTLSEYPKAYYLQQIFQQRISTPPYSSYFRANAVASRFEEKA